MVDKYYDFPFFLGLSVRRLARSLSDSLCLSNFLFPLDTSGRVRPSFCFSILVTRPSSSAQCMQSLLSLLEYIPSRDSTNYQLHLHSPSKSYPRWFRGDFSGTTLRLRRTRLKASSRFHKFLALPQGTPPANV